jgi:hypothetical protein
MDNIVVYGVSYLEFLLRASFMWLALLCIINFYARHDMNWFFMGCFFALLTLNRIWFYNVKLGEWILANKAHWLAGVDRVVPGLMVYEKISTWIMFIFCSLMFIGFVTLLSQLIYKKIAFVIASMALVVYMVAFSWWIFWVLNPQVVIPYNLIFGYKAVLVIFGNILFIIAFSLAIKREKLRNYAYGEID